MASSGVPLGQLDTYPDLLHTYMETLCDAVRTALLLEELPRKAVAQVGCGVPRGLAYIPCCLASPANLHAYRSCRTDRSLLTCKRCSVSGQAANSV